MVFLELRRDDEDLREPLVRRQGSQVSMRVARGSASWLSSHGRGLGPRDALKKPNLPLGLRGKRCRDPRCSPRGNPACRGSRGDRTSGFLSVSYSDSSVPAALGQESQASSCMRKGTPLASRVAQGVSGPPSSCVWNPGALAQSPGREAALAWASLAQRFPASSVLARTQLDEGPETP